MSSQLSHHPQEVFLAQFSLYVHKGGLKPDLFHFHLFTLNWPVLMNSGNTYGDNMANPDQCVDITFTGDIKVY